MTNKEQTTSNLKKLKSFHNGSYAADIDKAIKALEQEPCEDCISRQAVLDEISDYKNDLDYTTNELYDRIKRMPSVNPKTEKVIRMREANKEEYEDIAKAFQFGMALGFGEKHDEMDRVIDEIKKVITGQNVTIKVESEDEE